MMTLDSRIPLIHYLTNNPLIYTLDCKVKAAGPSQLRIRTWVPVLAIRQLDWPEFIEKLHMMNANESKAEFANVRCQILIRSTSESVRYHGILS